MFPFYKGDLRDIPVQFHKIYQAHSMMFNEMLTEDGRRPTDNVRLHLQALRAYVT